MKRFNKLEMSFMVPQNLLLDEFLAKNPPAFRFKTDNFAFILDLMYKIPARNRAIKENRKYNGKVPINAQILQKSIRNYDKYLEYLIEHGILMTDDNYIIGEKSKYYWFTKKYICKAKKYPAKDFTIIKKLKKEQFNPLNYTYCRHLSKWFDDKLSIDFDAAMNYTEHIYVDALKTGSKKKIKEATNSYISTTTCIDFFNRQQYFFHKDDTGGRLHTNFTNISAEIRNFISYGDKKLVSVDVKNSQPYFSLLTLQPEFYKSSSSSLLCLKNLDLNTTQLPKSFIPQSSLSLIYYMLGDSSLHSVNHSNMLNDIDKYRNMVSDGSLYEYFLLKLKEKYNIILKDRDDAKHKIFLILYSNENTLLYDKVMKIRELFANEFPIVNRVFQLLKEKNHEALAIILQRIESKFILEIVTPEFAKLFPKVPLYTIHDSVVTLVGYEKIVTNIIRSKAYNLIGTTPTVDPEYWSPANLS